MGGVVAVCAAAGTASSTTCALTLASSMPAGEPVLFAECDPSGGDLAAWADLRETPGWSTAVAGGDRSWAGLRAHFQEMPSGLSVLCSPTQARTARPVVRESAARFGSLLGSMSDVVTVADCGRIGSDLPAWLAPASLVLLLVRQAPTSTGATVARVDRAAEVTDRLGSSEQRVGLVVVGSRPYDPQQLVDAIGGELFGVLPEDPFGAGLAAGAWTVGRGASRSPLARAARELAATVVETLTVTETVVPFSGSRSEHAG
jgi:hypothetical protein